MKTRRGFTLIEMMTALVILSVIIAGISQVLIKQSQASSAQSLQRDQEESGRLALLEIARNVRLAGYGISPLFAFDFDRYKCTTPGTVATCNGGAHQRDRIDGPDEIVFSYRDPGFSRDLTGVSGGSSPVFSFARPLQVAIPVGAIVGVVGAGGTALGYYAVSTAAAVGDTSVSAATLNNNSAGYYAPSPAPDASFSSGTLILVTRVRYFVKNDTDGVPSLYKDRGNGDELLYRGIEDVQYSYDIAQPPPGSPFASGGARAVAAPATCAGTATYTVGNCPGTLAQPSSAATAPDWQNDAYDSANRYTANPANIRAVNITIVARSTRPSPDGVGDPPVAAANRNDVRAADKFKRTVLQMSEKPMNLLARQTFRPFTVSTGPDLAKGGG